MSLTVLHSTKTKAAPRQHLPVLPYCIGGEPARPGGSGRRTAQLDSMAKDAPLIGQLGDRRLVRVAAFCVPVHGVAMASDSELTAAEKVIESQTSRSMCRAWRAVGDRG
jgi:hypothetical protein